MTEAAGLFGAQVERDTVSKSELARHLNVVPSQVTAYIAKGMPMLAGGRCSIKLAKAWVAANIDPVRSQAGKSARGLAPRPSSDTSRLQAERADRERAKAEREQLELEKAKGRLIDRLEAARAIEERARLEHDQHLGWVSRVAPLLAAELQIDAAPVFAVLDREMREHLMRLADMPLPLKSDADGA